MEQNIKKIGLINLVVMVLVGAAGAGLAWYSNTLAGQIGAAFLGFGVLVMAISYVQMRLEDSEKLEKLEYEEIIKSKSGASLFESSLGESFPAQRSREQFERFFVPVFSVLLLILQAGGVYVFWNWLDQPVLTQIRQPAVAMSLFSVFALALFLMGKYSSGIARLRGARLLRPGSSYMLMGAYVCFLVAGGIAAVQLDFPKIDLYAARVFTVILGLAAVENLLSLILEIYRPRVKGRVDERVLYESRLVGLLAQPESLFTTAAHALDYQFGFKVSDTWVYKFLQNALGWIILAQLLILAVSTMIVFISPGEQGLIERFGRPLTNRPVLEPGVHFKMPWPIDRVYRASTRAIQSFSIGFVPDEEMEKENTVVWTRPHYKEEFNLLVASPDQGLLSTAPNGNSAERGVPVDLLTASIPVQYQIKDLRAWFYNHTDAGQLLEKIGNREVVRYLASVDIMNVMSSGRSKAAEDIKKLIQTRADEFQLGVNVVFVGLQDIHPPVKVATNYQAVIAVGQENQAKLREVEGYAAKTRTLAVANAAKMVYEAQAVSNRIVTAAHADVAQLTNQMVAYNAAPDAYRMRAYYKALERGATNIRKFVVTLTNAQDVINMNFEEKPRIGIDDIAVPDAKTQK